MLDGGYQRGKAGPLFVESPPLTGEDVQVAPQEVVGRLPKRLARRGALAEVQDSMHVTDEEGDSNDPREAAFACGLRVPYLPIGSPSAREPARSC